VFAEAAGVDPARTAQWAFAKTTEVMTYSMHIGDRADMDGLRLLRDLARAR
jgi:hypothetical protein